jgi:hypothetical protein
MQFYFVSIGDTHPIFGFWILPFFNISLMFFNFIFKCQLISTFKVIFKCQLISTFKVNIGLIGFLFPTN